MQMQQLRYFLEIAKEKNISAAAKNLYLSQPSLSQQIRKLEEELEVPLLIRHSKSVSLTDAGEQFAHHARRILGGVDQLAELMHKQSLLEAGTLKIGLLWIAGYTNILQILSSYHTLHPGLNYAFSVNGSAHLLQTLLERKIHAAFIISTEEQLEQEADLDFCKIHEDSYSVIISRQNPLAAKEIICVEDLKDTPIIMPSQASALRKSLDRIFEEAGIMPNILCETSQSDLVIQLASHDLGVGISSQSIADSMQTGAYAILPFESRLHRSIFYVTLKELLDYPSIRSFTRYVKRYQLISGRTPLISPGIIHKNTTTANTAKE